MKFGGAVLAKGVAVDVLLLRGGPESMPQKSGKARETVGGAPLYQIESLVVGWITGVIDELSFEANELAFWNNLYFAVRSTRSGGWMPTTPKGMPNPC